LYSDDLAFYGIIFTVFLDFMHKKYIAMMVATARTLLTTDMVIIPV
jgi:hypothetical protein